MSTPAYLWLEDENGSTIVGGCCSGQGDSVSISVAKLDLIHT